MNWDKLKIFHAVAEAGSFTSATAVLNISQSAISRQIQSLEEDVNIKLFERHARGLVLTENGEYLYKTAQIQVKQHLNKMVKMCTKKRLDSIGIIGVQKKVGYLRKKMVQCLLENKIEQQMYTK